jgi:adenine-specific DNA-methyltransferase
MKANGIKGDVSSDYSVSAPLQHRRRFGQFFTPPRIALLMADWVLSSGASRIVDPAFGTGALAEACLSRNPDLQVTGYEKDSNILAFVPNEIRSKAIIHQTDFLTADVSRSFDGVIMNPPYIRHREIKDKEPARSRIAVQTGCFIPASANLYVYFILKGIAVTTSGARMAFLVPSEWMSANFSKALKRFLVEKGLLREIVTFSNCSDVFGDAITTASLLFLEKES